MNTIIIRANRLLLPVILTLAGILLSSGLVFAQSSIANTRIELKENKIHVTYDIENSNRSELYNVTLEVTNAAGELLRINSLSGDVGTDVPGGNRKEIVWDLEVDGIQMDAEIYFQVVAEAIVVPEPVVVEPVVEEPIAKDPVKQEAENQDAVNQEDELQEAVNQETTAEETVTDRSKNENMMEEIDYSRFNRTGLILQSLALPGLGLSRMTGNPHWIRGVAGYGCLTGAVIFNRKALSSYDLYLEASSGDIAGTNLEQSTKQDNISELCAYAAIGIWVADVVWTMTGTSRLSKPLAVRSGYDPVSRTPMLAISYKF